MPAWNTIAADIARTTGEPFSVSECRSVGGGCINSAYVIGDGRRRLFVKLNQASRLAMFEAEAEGLNEIVGSQSIHAPQPICWGIAGTETYLVMEHLEGQTLAQQLEQGPLDLDEAIRIAIAIGDALDLDQVGAGVPIARMPQAMDQPAVVGQ